MKNKYVICWIIGSNHLMYIPLEEAKEIIHTDIPDCDIIELTHEELRKLENNKD